MDEKTFAENVTPASTLYFNKMFSFYIAMGRGIDSAIQSALEDERRFIEERLRQSKEG